ncbi:hypothetical protein [Benzoatithermus flavus]|uniref:Uncharacterized protein n=1 Tax=Benzoatithermus flavus TaxID=3108223 RepID=A0ABU8XR21_9PROT
MGKVGAPIAIGAALVGASFLLPGAPIFAGAAMSWSGLAFGTGVSVILGAAATALTPKPSTGLGGQAARQTVVPIPVPYQRYVYGRTRTGGNLI